MYKLCIIFACCLCITFALQAAKVDTIEINSSYLQKKVKIAVVTPKTQNL
jgi:hypothetical protein